MNATATKNKSATTLKPPQGDELEAALIAYAEGEISYEQSAVIASAGYTGHNLTRQVERIEQIKRMRELAGSAKERDAAGKRAANLRATVPKQVAEWEQEIQRLTRQCQDAERSLRDAERVVGDYENALTSLRRLAPDSLKRYVEMNRRTIQPLDHRKAKLQSRLRQLAVFDRLRPGTVAEASSDEYEREVFAAAKANAYKSVADSLGVTSPVTIQRRQSGRGVGKPAVVVNGELLEVAIKAADKERQAAKKELGKITQEIDERTTEVESVLNHYVPH